MGGILSLIIAVYPFLLTLPVNEIEKTLERDFYAEKVKNFWIVNGKIHENIEKYIVLEYPDKIHKKIWKELIFKSKIKVMKIEQGSKITINSEIKVLGWPDKIFVPPVYEKRKSSGKLEREIFRALNDKELREKFKKKIKSFDFPELDPPFEQNIDLITTPPADVVTQNELSCEIKGAKIVAGWNDQRGTGGGAGYTVGMSYSADSGVSWSQNQFPADGLWYPEQGDPVLTWGKGDTVYFAFITFDRYAWQGDIGFLISPDGGATWSDSINITNDSSFDDKPWISAYGDTVLLSYMAGAIYFRKSIDGGLTFSAPVYINSGGNGSMPKMGPNGEIYVMWGLDSPQNWQYDQGIWMRKSTDGGNSFGSTVHVADLYDSQSLLPWRCYAIPSMDVDMTTGYVYITYQSTDAGHTHWDAYIARSIDGGNSFETPVRINDVTTGHQFFPWVSVDEYSRVHVIWYDTREGGYNLDIYYAYSDDYGQTFSPSMRVTDVTKPPVGQTFIGDYIAVDATNGVVGAAWCHPATDNSSDNAWFARMTYTSVSEKYFAKTKVNLPTINPDLRNILKIKGVRILDTRGRRINSYRNLKNGVYFIDLNGQKVKILRIRD